jgi:Cu+-exporting ATPase
MTVEIAGAEHHTEYNGQTFYFCCPGCKESFEREPEKYLTQATPSGEAIDPVCGMTVEIATAKYMSEYQGQLYYFCAPGCKLSFDRAPEKYLGVPAGGAPIELT